MISSNERKALFEKIRKQYAKPPYLESDPLRYVYRFNSVEDRELAALLASLFAYGRVQSIFGFLDRLFLELGPSPAARLARSGIPHPPAYRFQTGPDVRNLLHVLGQLIRERGFPLFDFSVATGDAYEAVDRLIEMLHESLPRTRQSPGLRFLFGRAGSSPAKRLCLFYRWMVRKGFPDTGIYTRMTPARLIIPLDTHILRLARWTGLCSRRAPDRKTAREITAQLRLIRPGDPLIYDFALTRPGILRDQSALALLADQGH